MANSTEPPVRIPWRQAAAHKGDFGRVLLLAGSRGMAGAAILAGSATLRAGAGLVTVATPRAVQPTVAAGNWCYMTLALAEDSSEAQADLIRQATQSNVFAAGPGLHHFDSATECVHAAIQANPSLQVVLDADGLAALGAGRPQGTPGEWVITPHPGEFARLTNLSIEAVQADRERLAQEFARKHNVIVLLKGHRTVVTDGVRLYLNDTGNPGMATGGCGDVLTGVIAGLLGQSMSAFDAACLGAWVQGRAGDFATDYFGEVAMTAQDVLDALPQSLRLAMAVRSALG